MWLQVHHRTVYHYIEAVTQNTNELRLTPRDCRWQFCESAFITVLPATRLSHYTDLNWNRVHHFEISTPHRQLVIESRARVHTRSKVSYDRLPYGFSHQDLGRCRRVEDCHPFLQDSTYVSLTPEAWRLALDIQAGSTDVFQTAYAIMEHVYRNFSYIAGSTTVSTHASEVLRQGSGVCQDFAHAMVALCRSLGIPARYVSGYLFDSTRDHSMRGAEASHAWAEVYIDPAGWIGLDPTNNKVVDETYIVLATGRDYRDVAPVVGSYYGGSGSTLEVAVRVERMDRAGLPVNDPGA